MVVNAPSESIDRHARTACAHVIARKSQWLEVFTGFDNALIVEWFTTYLTENNVYTIKRSNGITATSSDPEVLDSLSDGDVVAQHVNLALAAQSFLEAHSDPSSRWDNNSLARVVVCKFHDGAKFRASTFGIDPGRHNLDDPARRLNARTLNEDTYKLFNGYTPAGGFPWLLRTTLTKRERTTVSPPSVPRTLATTVRVLSFKASGGICLTTTASSNGESPSLEKATRSSAPVLL